MSGGFWKQEFEIPSELLRDEIAGAVARSMIESSIATKRADGLLAVFKLMPGGPKVSEQRWLDFAKEIDGAPSFDGSEIHTAIRAGHKWRTMT